MEFSQLVKRRASVRSFRPCEVSREELEQIADAGRRAPTGYNRQPWEFILIRDPELIRRLGSVQGCIANAGAVIGVVIDFRASDYWIEDASAAIENMLLCIVDLGYDSLWVEGFLMRKEEETKKMLGVPKALRLLALLPVGIPAETPEQAPKRAVEELIHWEYYGGRSP